MIWNDWFSWALLSALLAAMTAIFAKVGLEGVDSDYATLIRTFVIIGALAIFVGMTNKWRNPLKLELRTISFLVMSGLATGASWVLWTGLDDETSDQIDAAAYAARHAEKNTNVSWGVITSKGDRCRPSAIGGGW